MNLEKVKYRILHKNINEGAQHATSTTVKLLYALH